MNSKKKKRRSPNLLIDITLVLGILTVISIFLLILTTQEPKVDTIDQVEKVEAKDSSFREPAVAGVFYPKDKHELENDLQGYLSNADKDTGVYGIRGLVSPHAGYIYSGLTAAQGYVNLIDTRYDTVIVMGPAHRKYLQSASVVDEDLYRTPLGDVRISAKVKELLKEDIFIYDPDVHELEHSVEVQIPFLQKVLPPFELIPIVVGDADPIEIADALEKIIDDDTLIIASSDLSHYKGYDECNSADQKTTDAITALDIKKMALEGDACGKIPAMVLMEIAKRRGWRTKLLDLRNSGDTAGTKDSVVGYSSIAFYDGLDQKEQEKLLEIAQKTLNAHYRRGSYEVDESELTEMLKRKSACFVTLNKGSSLRGCIGHLTAQEKLYECVQVNALNAALRDPRFNPVPQSELPEIRIEISVLNEARPMQYNGWGELLEKLLPNIDGVIIDGSRGRSTYLPVVWEQLPDKAEFLTRLCEKGGNDGECWKEKDTRILTYQAQEFHQLGFK